MTLVSLLVTGQCEHRGLEAFFRRLCPALEFVTRPLQDSFTSSIASAQLTAAHDPGSKVRILAATMVAEVAPGRRDQQRPDYVVVVDDLEIVNASDPERVVRTFACAVERHLEEHGFATMASKENARHRVRESCSFHLLAPMVEAYFYRDPTALRAARGGKVDRSSRFDPTTCDVEQFTVDDLSYLGPADLTKDERRKRGADVWRVIGRQRHPKHYIEYLSENVYRETHEGVAALTSLGGGLVLADPQHARFARSLANDLASMANQQAWPGQTQTLTDRTRATVMRNV